MASLEKRIGALERMRAGVFTTVERENLFPYLSDLSADELNDVTRWVFGSAASWKPRRPDSYFAGLLFKAMNGTDMPQGYDWLNNMLGGKLPEGRIAI